MSNSQRTEKRSTEDATLLSLVSNSFMCWVHGPGRNRISMSRGCSSDVLKENTEKNQDLVLWA